MLAYETASNVHPCLVLILNQLGFDFDAGYSVFHAFLADMFVNPILAPYFRTLCPGPGFEPSSNPKYSYKYRLTLDREVIRL